MASDNQLPRQSVLAKTFSESLASVKVGDIVLCSRKGKGYQFALCTGVQDDGRALLSGMTPHMELIESVMGRVVLTS